MTWRAFSAFLNISNKFSLWNPNVIKLDIEKKKRTFNIQQIFQQYFLGLLFQGWLQKILVGGMTKITVNGMWYSRVWNYIHLTNLQYKKCKVSFWWLGGGNASSSMTWFSFCVMMDGLALFHWKVITFTSLFNSNKTATNLEAFIKFYVFIFQAPNTNLMFQ